MTFIMSLAISPGLQIDKSGWRDVGACVVGVSVCVCVCVCVCVSL